MNSYFKYLLLVTFVLSLAACKGEVGNTSDIGGGANEQINGISRIQATKTTFVLYKQSGGIDVWQSAEYSPYWGNLDHEGIVPFGADIHSVVEAKNEGRFAGLKVDGSIVTWGSGTYPEAYMRLSDELSGVQGIYANNYSFAAIIEQGSIETWGMPYSGGDSEEVEEAFVNISELVASQSAFAALRVDGSVVTWGNTIRGDEGKEFTDDLVNIKSIISDKDIFVAVSNDGHVFRWGTLPRSSPSPLPFTVQESQYLENVSSIALHDGLYAIVKKDTTLSVMEEIIGEEIIESVELQIGSNIEDMTGEELQKAAQLLFAIGIHLEDWYPRAGSMVDFVQGLTGIESAVYRSEGLVAVKNNGDVVCWSDGRAGCGPSEHVIKGVVTLAYCEGTYLALRVDGSVVLWRQGAGDFSINTVHTNVESIHSNDKGFAVLKKDGSVVIWGNDLSTYVSEL